jgi:nucleotide-binding universal stress UspA family protein
METTRPITKILCPIDFDVNSLAALDMARDLSQENGASLHVLHVVVPHYPLIVSAPFLAERAHQYARIRLDEIARGSLRSVDHHLLLKTGDPAGTIISTAEEVGADLLVMATHGRTGVPRFFLGSVAERVVRESSCPVLTIRGVSRAEHAAPHAATGARNA